MTVLTDLTGAIVGARLHLGRLREQGGAAAPARAAEGALAALDADAIASAATAILTAGRAAPSLGGAVAGAVAALTTVGRLLAANPRTLRRLALVPVMPSDER
jgi:hypothetical protein